MSWLSQKCFFGSANSGPFILLHPSLGQLASLAGIDKFNFQPLGRPQLSSTIGPHLDDATSVTRKEYRDVQAKSRALVRIHNVWDMFASGNWVC